MTYFAQKLIKAIKPNTKLEQKLRVFRVTYTYASQADFEKEMSTRRKVKRG